MSDCLVIGGGHQGLAMAAHLSLCGEKVFLWNRTPQNIAEILKTNTIHCTGIVEGDAHINRTSSDIDEVMSDFIMVTTPATAHRDIAALLAPRVSDNTVIILNPGRTFGAIEFNRALQESGCKSMPKIAETQTIVYTCRRNGKNGVTIYALKNNVLIAALKNRELPEIINRLQPCLRPFFSPAGSIMETSLGNVGMILHCAPVLMNIGWIESSAAEFRYYYDGISESVARFLEKLDAERVSVAISAGSRVETACEWMKRTYGVDGNSLYECIHRNECYKKIDAPNTLHHRYLDEDVPCGLVPLESAGKHYGLKTPVTSLVIDLASYIMDKDYRKTGRAYIGNDFTDC